MTRGFVTFNRNADGDMVAIPHPLPEGAVWVGSFGGRDIGVDNRNRVWWMKGKKWLSVVDGNEILVDAIRYIARLEGFAE